MKIFDWLDSTWNAGIAAGRRHSRIFDHFWRARERYSQHLGGRLAAAIAYYSFFAVFALGLLAYSVLGYVLASNQRATEVVNKFLSQNLPFLQASDIASGRNALVTVGAIGLVFTGVGWIEAMRSSQRAIWRLEQQPGNWFTRRLVDLGVLIGVGVMLGFSLWVQTGIDGQIRPLLIQITPEPLSVGWQNAILAIGTVIGIVLALLVNCVLAASMLAGVARLRMPWRRLWPSTLLVAIGVLVLSTLGRAYINFSSNRPAYQVVGGTVGVLLFLYFFNQLLLFGAALAATSTHGTVVDLAARAPVPPEKEQDEGKPVHPEPLRPTEPKPAEDEPAQHEPAQSEPVQSERVQSEPVQSEPSGPETGRDEPAEPKTGRQDEDQKPDGSTPDRGTTGGG